MTRRNEILVGVDGSKVSDAALSWAATEARVRGCGLSIVYACDRNGYGLWLTTRALRDGLRELGRPIVDAAIARVHQLEPSIPVRGRVLVAGPARALIRLSTGAELTVVGRAGRRSLSRLVLGSVATCVLANAQSPAIAVGIPGDGRPVTVVDRVVAAVGEPATHRPVSLFAFEQARRRHASVVMLCAVPDTDAGEQIEPALRADLADWQASYPDVDASLLVAPGRLAEAVARVCSPLDIVVLGRGHAPTAAAHSLGWRAISVLHAAAGPVATVPEDSSRPPGAAPTRAVRDVLTGLVPL